MITRRSIFDQTCEIRRLKTVKDQYKTPRAGKAQQWDVIGTYPCRLSRKSSQANQEAPAMVVGEVDMLYLPISAQVQAGDLATVGSVDNYRLAEPYRPGNHHIEVQVQREVRT